PPVSYTPPEWARDVANLMAELGIPRATIVGHSAGGWTALDLAKLGRADGVLALAPAGLWRHHSPVLTDLRLNANWRLGRIFGPITNRVLRSRTGRTASLWAISGRPGAVPADVAVSAARTAIATDSFPRHFRETRVLRFEGGRDIEVPIKVIWGSRDR